MPWSVENLKVPSMFKRRPGFAKDRVAFLLDLARRDVDVEPVRMLGGLVKGHVLTTPELAHEVLVEQADAFVKSYGLSLFARPLLGDDLLTSEKDFHKKQRRMMAPALVHKRIGEYAAVIATRTETAQAGLRDGATIDVSNAMTSRGRAPARSRCRAPSRGSSVCRGTRATDRTWRDRRGRCRRDRRRTRSTGSRGARGALGCLGPPSATVSHVGRAAISRR